MPYLSISEWVWHLTQDWLFPHPFPLFPALESIPETPYSMGHVTTCMAVIVLCCAHGRSSQTKAQTENSHCPILMQGIPFGGTWFTHLSDRKSDVEFVRLSQGSPILSSLWVHWKCLEWAPSQDGYRRGAQSQPRNVEKVQGKHPPTTEAAISEWAS
ncbi:UNVERIFIED_CONTAM: hypothetical protein K2H54_058543 [Gekko kuhli]